MTDPLRDRQSRQQTRRQLASEGRRQWKQSLLDEVRLHEVDCASHEGGACDCHYIDAVPLENT